MTRREVCYGIGDFSGFRFRDIGPQARNRMVRDRFISEQQSCELRHHLDSFPPDTPIREIVDLCRVWESHSEQGRGPPPGTNVHRGQRVMASDSRESSFFTEDPLTMVASPEVEPQIPVLVPRVFAGSSASAREVRPEPGYYSGFPREPGVSPEIGKVLTQFFSQEGLSPLVARLIRAVKQENPAEEKVPPEAEVRWQ